MATLGTSFLDLVDVNKADDTSAIIELLAQTNPILQDAVAKECNMGTKHRHTVRTGLPSATWGKLYKGVPQSKSTRAQVDDTTGFLEAMSTVDKRLLTLAGKNGKKLRLEEAAAHLEGMSQTLASTMVYGDADIDPEKFTGLAPRFNDLSAPNGSQIIDGGGTGSDNTSIWVVTWGDNQTHTLFPQGTKAGITREDKGEQRVLDASGNPYYVAEEMFTVHTGLAVKDWRYVVRIANIDVSDMLAGTVDLYGLLRKAYYKHHGRRLPAGSTVIYANSDVVETLDRLAANAGASDSFIRLKPGKDIQGNVVDTYRGMPIRELDCLLNTEARVV